MSIGADSPAGSQYLSASHSSLGQSKKASSEISKIYKHASQLYLTRRLGEAYDVLQPVIRPPVVQEGHTSHTDEAVPAALVATAGTSQRIKIWSLYVTLLNAVVDLDTEDGKHELGAKEYGNVVRNVQSGNIWEEVVQNGYQGREGSVDAEVVYNLSNLLLAQAPNQVVNQSRLETYLSASSNLQLDISAHMSNSLAGRKRSHMSGANTPKDLSSRIKILELFTLHVLPRNDEWEYANSFINNSDILDEERREAFLQTLLELQEAKEQEEAMNTDAEDDFGPGQDYVDDADSQDGENDQQEREQTRDETTSRTSDRAGSVNRKTSSEVDYGIDRGHPNGNNKSEASKENPTPTATPSSRSKPTPQPTTPASNPSISTPTTSTQPPPHGPPSTTPSTSSTRRPSKPSSSTSKSKATVPAKQSSSSILRRASQIILLIRNLSVNLSTSLTKSPAAIMRTLMFIVAFLIMLSRRELRERIRGIVEGGWGKVMGTVGMGVKVSYI